MMIPRGNARDPHVGGRTARSELSTNGTGHWGDGGKAGNNVPAERTGGPSKPSFIDDFDGVSKGGRVQMGLVNDWPNAAACKNGDPDALFVQGAEQNVAKRVCRSCPVRLECLADALDNRIEFGVWGGMTERERRALLRRHPQVPSWKKTFEAALRERELATTG